MSFEKRDCERLVHHHLQLQRWQLLDATTLTERVWQAWLAGEHRLEPEQFVLRVVWKEYAQFLHARLCDANSQLHQEAWQALNDWMWGQIGRITTDDEAQVWIIQQALISLQKKLLREPLDAQRALWAYVLQAMRNKWIDYLRQQERERAVPLEQAESEQRAADTATPEEMVMMHDEEQQLSDFLRTHTNSELQYRVAVYSFVDGMTPREIAKRLGKKPHQIRLTKATVVQKLRQLPAAELQQLLEILSA